MEKEEYIVVYGENVKYFQLAVINKLQEGYQCVGGISVVKTLPTHGVGASYGGVEYYQSMILKEDEKTKKVL